MAKALFLALSAAFFIAYALVAKELLIPDQKTITFGEPNIEDCITQGEDEDESCIEDDPRVQKLGFFGTLIEFVTSSVAVSVNLFSPFFQLITFQAEGLESASIITALIFTPLILANSFIIFSTMRGSG